MGRRHPIELVVRAVAVGAMIAAGVAALALMASHSAFAREPGLVGLVGVPLFAWGGALLLLRARASCDATALGFFLPLVALSPLLEERSRPDSAVALLGPSIWVGAGASVLALGFAMRPPEDAARARVVLSALPIAALVPLLIATLVWFPEEYRPSSPTGRARIELAPQMVVAAGAALLVLFDLHHRRARAILWLLVTAISIDTSPSWGAWRAGCWTNLGPVDLFYARVLWATEPGSWARPLTPLLRPPVLTALALAPWVGPVVGWVRGRPSPQPSPTRWERESAKTSRSP